MLNNMSNALVNVEQNKFNQTPEKFLMFSLIRLYE